MGYGEGLKIGTIFIEGRFTAPILKPQVYIHMLRELTGPNAWLVIRSTEQFEKDKSLQVLQLKQHHLHSGAYVEIEVVASEGCTKREK